MPEYKEEDGRITTIYCQNNESEGLSGMQGEGIMQIARFIVTKHCMK